MNRTFKGIGCFTRLVDEWNKVFRATNKTRVIQEESMSGEARMTIRNSVWTIELGQ